VWEKKKWVEVKNSWEEEKRRIGPQDLSVCELLGKEGPHSPVCTKA